MTVIDDENYGVLYSVISWPNIVLSFFGGYLIDQVFGIRWGAITFTSFIAIGQVLLFSRKHYSYSLNSTNLSPHKSNLLF